MSVLLGHRYIHPIFQLGKFQRIFLLKTSLHQFSNCVSSKCLTCCLSFQAKQTITLFLKPSLSLPNGLASKTTREEGMEGRHGFSKLDFHSLLAQPQSL